MSERGGDSGRTSTRQTSKGHIRGNQKKRGGNHRKPRKRPLKKEKQTRKSLKKKMEKKDEKTFVNDLFMQKKPFVFSFYCCSCPITFPPAPSPSLFPSLSCLFAFRPVLLSSPLPFPTHCHSPFPHLPTYPPPYPLPLPLPLPPPDAILYYTIALDIPFCSIIHIIPKDDGERAKENVCMYRIILTV